MSYGLYNHYAPEHSGHPSQSCNHVHFFSHFWSLEVHVDLQSATISTRSSVCSDIEKLHVLCISGKLLLSSSAKQAMQQDGENMKLQIWSSPVHCGQPPHLRGHSHFLSQSVASEAHQSRHTAIITKRRGTLWNHNCVDDVHWTTGGDSSVMLTTNAEILNMRTGKVRSK